MYEVIYQKRNGEVFTRKRLSMPNYSVSFKGDKQIWFTSMGWEILDIKRIGSENMNLNKRNYINQYKKEHYSKLSVDLPKELKKELDDICKQNNITIKKFILDAIESKKKREF